MCSPVSTASRFWAGSWTARRATSPSDRWTSRRRSVGHTAGRPWFSTRSGQPRRPGFVGTAVLALGAHERGHDLGRSSPEVLLRRIECVDGRSMFGSSSRNPGKPCRPTHCATIPATATVNPCGTVIRCATRPILPGATAFPPVPVARSFAPPARGSDVRNVVRGCPRITGNRMEPPSSRYDTTRGQVPR